MSNNSPVKGDKICPLRVGQFMLPEDEECIEDNCGWWNENYKVCGMRLATKKELF